MKHMTYRRLRLLTLSLSLALCFGLFAGCSQDSEPSQEPSQEAAQSQTPSEEPSAAPEDAASQPVEDSQDNPDGGEAEAAASDVAGAVTALSDGVATIQIYSAPDDSAIDNYAAVDLSQYSATGETDQVDLTGAALLLAQDGVLTETDASQVAVGDMLVLTYEGGQLLQAVLYPQDSGGQDAA